MSVRYCLSLASVGLCTSRVPDKRLAKLLEAVEWGIVISTGEEHSIKWRWPQMVNSCLPFSLHTHFFDHNRPKCAFRCIRKESQ